MLAWERLKAGEGDDRGQDGWMASLTQWTWQPTPVFFPGESQGRQSLVGSCLSGHTELDTTEVI